MNVREPTPTMSETPPQPPALLLVGFAVLVVVMPASGCIFAPALKCANDSHCFDSQTCAVADGVCIPRLDPGPEATPLDGGREDAGAEPDPIPDGGNPDVDSGPIVVDSGPIVVDGGPLEVDGGPIVVDAGPDGGVDPQNPFGFDVETIDLIGLINPDTAGTLNLGQCAVDDEVVFNSTTLQFENPCDFVGANISVRDSLVGGGALAVITARTILVPAGTTFRIHGDKRVVLAAIDNVLVNGIVDATGKMVFDNSVTTSEPGPGGSDASVCGAPGLGANGRNGEETGLKRGAGGGGAGAVTAGAGGGTAGNGDLGGVGGDALSLPGVALFGGCTGGTGSGNESLPDRGQGGSGGGALHIIAGTIVSGTGTVNVSGAGGTGSRDQKMGGGGGGSGGSLWVTTSTLSFQQATALASGGGGSGGAPEDGAGFSTDGATATSPAAALGGGITLAVALNRTPGVGGIGGGLKFPSVGANARGDKAGGGGGGGSAGRLIFDVRGALCTLPTKVLGDVVTIGGCAPMETVCGDGSHDLPEQCDFGAFNLPAGEFVCGCSETCTWQPCEVLPEDDPLTNATIVVCDENEEDCFSDGEGAMDDAGVVMSCFPGDGLCEARCTDINRCQFLCPSGTCVFTCEIPAGDNPSCDAYCGPSSTCRFATCDVLDGCATHGASNFPSQAALLP